METLPIVAQNELAVSSQSSAAIAKVQAAYVMALQRPRNLDAVRLRVLDEAKRKKFAEKARYSRKIGTKVVSGISINGARALKKAFWNIHTDSGVRYDDGIKRIIWATAIDLECNDSATREAVVMKTVERRSKEGRDVVSERFNSDGHKVYEVVAYEQEVETKAAAALAKLFRECIKDIIPADICEEFLEAVEDTIRKDATVDPVTARKRMVDGFMGLNVRPEALCDYLGHGLDTITPQEITELRDIFTAIKDGEAKWTDFLPVDVKPEPKRASLDLGAMTPGDPETHTEPGEVQPPPEKAADPMTAAGLWADFIAYWMDQGASREQLNPIQQDACSTFKVKTPAKIPAEKVSEFADWLNSQDVAIREPGEEG